MNPRAIVPVWVIGSAIAAAVAHVLMEQGPHVLFGERRDWPVWLPFLRLLLPGVFVGAVQWLGARRSLPLTPLWVVATAAGAGALLYIGAVVAFGLPHTVNRLLEALPEASIAIFVAGALSGVALGAAQCLAVWNTPMASLRWLGATALGSGIGAVLLLLATPDFYGARRWNSEIAEAAIETAGPALLWMAISVCQSLVLWRGNAFNPASHK